MAKKKTQRTNWKEEHRAAIEDRNNYSGRCLRLEEKLKAATEEIAGQKRENIRLRNEADEVGRAVLAVSQIADQILTAPDCSFTDGEILEHGREVLLGRLIEKLFQIPKPNPF